LRAEACDADAWHLALEHKETGEKKSVPYRCRSWRHAGACAKARAADDARRIREGFIKYRRSMAYLVLTFNPVDRRPTRGTCALRGTLRRVGSHVLAADPKTRRPRKWSTRSPGCGSFMIS
jgi:hypothetical protein